MSKMSEMASTIEELRKCAAAISDAANWLAEKFSGDEAPEEPTPVKEPRSRSTVPTSCRALTPLITRRCLPMRRN